MSWFEYAWYGIAGLLVGVLIGMGILWLTERPEQPHWACAAEDEVVVIDHSCRHVDELQQQPIIQPTVATPTFVG